MTSGTEVNPNIGGDGLSSGEEGESGESSSDSMESNTADDSGCQSTQGQSPTQVVIFLMVGVWFRRQRSCSQRLSR